MRKRRQFYNTLLYFCSILTIVSTSFKTNSESLLIFNVLTPTPIVPQKSTIRLSASISFKIVIQSEYALGL